MAFIQMILSNRRGWAFLVPIAVIGLQRAGITTNDATVNTAIDQAAGVLAGVLSLWSLFKPKP